MEPNLKKIAAELRIQCLEMTHRARSGHPTSALSCIEILVALYCGEIDGRPILKHDPQKPHADDRDYFVLSKIHASPALYAVLAHRGFFPKEELNRFCSPGTLLQAFPVRKIPGVETSTGTLGHGLALANGIALGLKMDKKMNRVYMLAGASELQKGEMWEAALAASHHKLDNVTLLIDNNKLQQGNFIRAIKNIEPIGAKFSAFGWNVINVADGHNFDELKNAIRRAWNTKLKPTAVVCDTVKGKGVPFAENKANYHGVAFSDEEMAVAIPILKKEMLK